MPSMLNTLMASSYVVQAFDLPPGRTPASYFRDVDGARLGLLVLALLATILIYFALYKRDGNFSQVIAIFLIILVWVWFGGTGLTAVRKVITGGLHMGWDWLTS